jgi:hypothetical protein
MTDNRLSGLAFLAGQLGMILTLSLHPSGKISPAQVDQMAHKLIAVHSIALASLPFMILGALGLSRALSSRLSIAAFVFYSFGIAALLSGIVIDGLVMPSLLPHLAAAAQATAAAPLSSDVWRTIFRYNGYLDMAFVQVSMVASAVAIIVWSLAMVLTKTLSRTAGIYGLVLGAVALIALLSGALGAEHAISVMIFGQATWFLIVGGTLWAQPQRL